MNAKSSAVLLFGAAVLAAAGCSGTGNGASTVPAPDAAPQSVSGAVQRPAAASALRQTAQAPSVLFSDNFSADAVGSAANGWNAVAGTWQICLPAGSAKAYCSISLNHEESFPTVAGAAWTDYELDADIQKTAPGSLELLTRVQDPNHFYSFSIEVATNPSLQHWALRAFNNGNWNNFKHGDLAVPVGRLLHTRFVVAGSTLTVYAAPGSQTPVQLASVTDGAYARGGIGLRTSATSNAYFSNIVVTGPSNAPASPTPAPGSSPTPGPGSSPTPAPVRSASPAPGTSPSPAPTGGPGGTKITPVSADHIADMVGVDTHFDYDDSPYVTVPLVRSTFVSSDLRHYRDTTPGLPNGSIGLPVTGETASDLAAKLRARPGAQFFELCGNEQDNSSYGSSWPSVLQKCVAQELPLVRAYNLPVVAPSLRSVQNSSLLGHLNVDYSNVHFSTCGDNPGTTRYATLAGAAAATAAVNAKYWVTETSYDSRRTPTQDNSLYGRGCAIPDRYIAAYDVRTILEWERLGAGRVYFYQGADWPQDTVFGGTGLLNPDGTRKPQFTALTNLVAVFSEPGAPAATTPVNVSISAATNVHDVVTEKSNGTLLVAIWRESTDISWETQKPFSIPLAAASVGAAGYAVTALHEFMPDGSLKTVTTNSGSLALGPDAVVVELHRN